MFISEFQHSGNLFSSTYSCLVMCRSFVNYFSELLYSGKWMKYFIQEQPRLSTSSASSSSCTGSANETYHIYFLSNMATLLHRTLRMSAIKSKSNTNWYEKQLVSKHGEIWSRGIKALEQHECGHTPFLIATGLNMVITSIKLQY